MKLSQILSFIYFCLGLSHLGIAFVVDKGTVEVVLRAFSGAMFLVLAHLYHHQSKV